MTHGDEHQRLSTGRRIVVAGVSGPGSGIATALAGAGAQVAVLTPTGQAAGATGDGIHPVACDFSTEAEVTTAVAAAAKVLGGVDQFVFAYYPATLTGASTFADIDEETWAKVCEGTLDAA